ncbi:hypothetical protein GQ457_01G011960 [Hibiscus cannabinus]
MVYRKQGEPLPQKFAVDSRDSGNSNHYNGNGLLCTAGSSINKAVFEKDLPSIRTEERQGVPETARVSSPGFSTASQSVEGWT